MSTRQASRTLRSELEAIVGPEHVLRGAAARPYETDASVTRGLRGVPDAVVLPGSVEEVQAIVGWACEQGQPLVPRGGGTGLAGGAVPVGGGTVVALERLNRIIEPAPERLTITVQAGVSTATVKRLARENGLHFPPDPGAAEQSQIGGNAATNAGGPHAFKYGATGAWVTGLEAVVVPGELIKVGGSRRKDVGGYDIKSLLVGSEGTLAIITAVTLALAPAPERALPVVLFFETAEVAVETMLDGIASGLEPAVLDYLDAAALTATRAAYPGDVPRGAGFVLLSELDGTEDEVARGLRELRELAGGRALSLDTPRPADVWRWRDGVGSAVTGMRGGKVSEDIVVAPERLADALGALSEIGRGVGLETCSWGHAGDGNMHACFLIDPADPRSLGTAARASERLFELAIELGGAITGEHGIGYLKRGQLARQWDERALALHEQIKGMFDPAGILNPGKKLARL